MSAKLTLKRKVGYCDTEGVVAGGKMDWMEVDNEEGTSRQENVWLLWLPCVSSWITKSIVILIEQNVYNDEKSNCLSMYFSCYVERITMRARICRTMSAPTTPALGAAQAIVWSWSLMWWQICYQWNMAYNTATSSHVTVVKTHLQCLTKGFQYLVSFNWLVCSKGNKLFKNAGNSGYIVQHV